MSLSKVGSYLVLPSGLLMPLTLAPAGETTLRSSFSR